MYEELYIDYLIEYLNSKYYEVNFDIENNYFVLGVQK